MLICRWNWRYPGSGNSLRWPRNILYRRRLALTSLTSGGRSVGIIHLRTRATEFLVTLFPCQKLPSFTFWRTRSHMDRQSESRLQASSESFVWNPSRGRNRGRRVLRSVFTREVVLTEGTMKGIRSLRYEIMMFDVGRSDLQLFLL
jgi:hypothetical protein